MFGEYWEIQCGLEICVGDCIYYVQVCFGLMLESIYIMIIDEGDWLMVEMWYGEGWLNVRCMFYLLLEIFVDDLIVDLQLVLWLLEWLCVGFILGWILVVDDEG